MNALISSLVLLATLGCTWAIISSSLEVNKAQAHDAPQVSNNKPDVPTPIFSEFMKKQPKIKISVGRRRGRGPARKDWMCHKVIDMPPAIRSSMRLSSFYRKYTHAYGIPIISSHRAASAALKRACYIVRFLFADRLDIRDAFHNNYGRTGVIAETEGTTTIPEHSFLPNWWNQRARGLGATPQIPISTGGEENLLCRRSDRYFNQDIFMHEFSHGVHLVGAELAMPRTFKNRLQTAYSRAMSRGLWRNTYAATDYREYFAQGTNSYFDTQAEAEPPNGIHNHVNTRAELAAYDKTLYDIVKDIFPCMNIVLKRCDKGKTTPPIKMHCDGKRPQTQAPEPQTQAPEPPTGGPEPPTRGPEPPTKCEDEWKLDWCTWKNKWACSYDCARNFCRKTCDLCSPEPPLPPTEPPTEPPLPPTSVPCKDGNNYCSSWASRGNVPKTLVGC